LPVRRTPLLRTLTALLLIALACGAAAASEGQGGEAAGEGHGGHASIGERLPLWSTIPFLGILLSIAMFPLVAPRFWHQHYPKVSAAWALVFALPFFWAFGAQQAGHEVAHILFLDYLPFIILLWGLYTAAGGIVVRGTLAGTPAVNTAFLAIGTAIASWIGTTGAAMLLIRPVLRANAHRKRKYHVVVFFIFLVANIGGSLTPLGDPPLFLGFLHGVPFFWTLGLFPHMSVMAVCLLVLFYFVDRRFHRKDDPGPDEPSRGARPRKAPPKEKLRVNGAYNLLFIGGIMGAVLLSGTWRPGVVHLPMVDAEIQNLVRDGLILLMGLLSLLATPKVLRRDNGFTWEPIREVAFLFAGIFVTIIPALAILKAGENGQLAFLIRAVRDPAHYFWVTGLLSSFLDNAPTYLTFFNSELGRFYPGLPESEAVAQLIRDKEIYLQAVAAGAVFMGANTYIGNAPNFMVKSIAEEAGVAMPSFFGFLLRWSLPILFPLFALVTLIFFL
jgi:Na+/H+ antiporter NhaD/arsenite permease-like protein